MSDSELKPFGTRPEDAGIAGICLGAGGWFFSSVMGTFLHAAHGETLWSDSSSTPWFFKIAFATLAIVVALRVRDWVVRTALLIWAVNFVLSIRQVAAALHLNPLLRTSLYGVWSIIVIIAAWPYASRRARIVTAALFMFALAFKLMLPAWRPSVMHGYPHS
jgi:hypothetical protein